jgi:hypothetical protein
MAHPEAHRRYVDETQEALRSLVVAGSDEAGVLQLFEEPFDQVAQTMQGPVGGYTLLSLFTHPLPGRASRTDVPRGG